MRPRPPRTPLLVVLLLGAASACHRSGAHGGGAPSASSSAEAAELPPLVLKDDTANVLLTWLDDQGDFHVVEHVADVPEAGRVAARVVIADRTDGTGESIYVADLRTKGADGAYPVRTMPRAEWDERGASKRKARMEALAPKAEPPPGSPSASESPAGPGAVAQAPAGVTAIIYGASWCNPCHQAQALLESLGVKVTKKDIEESDAAQREMQEKLRRIHRQGGSIPVIDVMGQIFVGYSEGALRAAVAKARSGTL
ncbi:MAG TPA: glutaredoxin family protein [Polyangiaceae bacterium]